MGRFLAARFNLSLRLTYCITLPESGRSSAPVPRTGLDKHRQ